jgi:hypothetical protein
MEDLERLFDQKRAQRREQELQMNEMMREMQSQR